MDKNKIIQMALERMFRAHDNGNEKLAERLAELTAAAESGGFEEFYKSFLEGPEYNAPRAQEARAYIKQVLVTHNAAVESLRHVFEKNAGNVKVDKKLQAAFNTVCLEMKNCTVNSLYTYPNGSTLTGPLLVIEAELGLDLVLRMQAHDICNFWMQEPKGIEIGARAALKIPENAGPSLAN